MLCITYHTIFLFAFLIFSTVLYDFKVEYFLFDGVAGEFEATDSTIQTPFVRQGLEESSSLHFTDNFLVMSVWESLSCLSQELMNPRVIPVQ